MNITLPTCGYCLGEHDPFDYCKCYHCGIEMDPHFIRCLIIDGRRVSWCPTCADARLATPRSALCTPHCLRLPLLVLATIMACLAANAVVVGYLTGGEPLLAAILFSAIAAFLLKARNQIQL